jgi:uncharacterized protein
MIKRLVARIVDAAGRMPFVVLFCVLAAAVGAWSWAAYKWELRSELLELLPRESPGFKAFEHQLGRTGGGAPLIVVNESPDRKANEKFIDDLTARLNKDLADRKACVDAKRADCGPDLIAYLETGTKDVHKFFEDTKWLYADIADLQNADDTLDHQIAIKSGLVSNLDDDDDDKTPPKPAPAPTPAPTAGDKPAPGTAATPPPAPPAKKSALGMDEFRDRWKSKAKQHDDFPTGYFATPDGKMMALRVVSTSSGMGGSAEDLLLQKLQQIVADLKPTSYHPEMKVGYAGHIANVVAEKDSLLSEGAWAGGIGFVLIVVGIVFFFRSPWSLPVVALPAIVGVGCAYAFAMTAYGHVNTAGLFLGIIILGNGINYPIVLLSRYREFRARGMSSDVARRDAVWNAFRAELVGAMVGSIAYGSLVITRFRGFNQFGMIGFVGMLAVWLSMIPTVPAMIVLIERLQKHLPEFLRDPTPNIAEDGTSGPIMRTVARISQKAPRLVVALAAVVTIVALVKLPPYLKDPWEYNFAKLGSRSSKVSGAGDWSNKADTVFGGKMNVAGALMLADTPEQVPLVKKKILENDAKDPQGQLLADVATIYDIMPGTAEEQKQKLAILDSIRDRLTPAVLNDMDPEERKRVEEIRPPDDLKPLAPKDLPPLLRRRFEENNGVVGTVFYVKTRNDVSLSDGHNLLRIAASTDNVQLDGGVVVQTASRSTIFSEMIRSMERDGPLATGASFLGVLVVVVFATSSLRGAFAVLAVLVMAVIWTAGGAAFFDARLNYINFIAFPITFGIGCEYPFNVFDRSRLLGGDVDLALRRTGGAVVLCSYTTIVGYGALLFADFQALQSFGQLAMSGEIACLVGAMLVLPAILHLMPKWRSKMKATHSEAHEATLDV